MFCILSEHFNVDYTNEVERPLKKMIWIMFMLLAILFFTVGVLMLRRLRLYYKGFFKEFGCSLWVANVMLTLPLCFRAVFDWLYFDKAWINYWFSDEDENFYKESMYNLMVFTFGTYIPMLMQIFSLIFGFVRQKQVKLFKHFNKSGENG